MKNNTRAILKSRIEEGTVVVCVGGEVTRETMKAVRDETFRLVVMSETAKRLLCDMGSAQIVMTDADWRQCAEEQASIHSLAIPTALLVPDVALAHAWRYSDRINASGRACVAFKNAEDAYLWADLVLPRAQSSPGTRPRSRSTRGRAQPPSAPGQ